MNRLVDAGVLGTLVLALLFVVVVDKLLTAPQQPDASSGAVQTGQPMVIKLAAPAKQLRLAVTQSYQDKSGKIWDDMPKLLSTLGEGYKFRLMNSLELLDSKKLEEVDVLFLTCAPGGADATRAIPEEAFTANLRKFVSDGGTIYASDWRYDSIAAAFPDVASNRLKGDGRGQLLDAQVVDAGLRDVLQSDTIPLKFDLDKWKTAAFAGDRVKVLVEGQYHRQQFGIAQAPLLVKFQFGKGTVIFTSFHNEAQNSVIEQKLLKYLVFSAVTAQLENQVNQSLVQGGFSPQKQNLLSASRDNPKVSYNYQSTKAGNLLFVLGFDDRGAKLKLTVTSPAGKTTTREGTSTFEIPEISTGPGEWRYTVEALSVPFQDFPFTVTVAEK